MKTLHLREFYKALAIDEGDVRKFRLLAMNAIQVVFRDGHEATFKLKPGRIVKKI